MDHEKTMRTGYERISAGDVDGFGELVAADFVEREEMPGYPSTKEGALAFFRDLLTSFPDLRMNVDDVIVGGDKAVARVTASATHKGEFMGIPATGKRIAMPMIDIMRFDAAGLVCEHWGVTDMLALMEQIGAVPGGPPA